MDPSLARLRNLIPAFPRQRIVVIGDLMLDHLIVGDARRISPEAPIPVVNFLAETFSPGGAGNVACNLAALGSTVDLFGVVGDDQPADRLRTALAAQGISPAGLMTESGRPTTVKTRITAQRHQIVRVDRETSRPIAPRTVDELLAAIQIALPGAAAVILADYAKGVVEQQLVDAIIAQARRLNLPVCIDPKPTHSLSFRGCALLTPNRREAFMLAGLADHGTSAPPASDESLLRAAALIQERHQPAALLVTLSEAGLLLLEDDQPPHHIPTVARQVYDVTGAGDTVIATFVLARAAGASATEAAAIANLAAGIVVGKTGTAPVTPDELLAWLSASGMPPR